MLRRSRSIAAALMRYSLPIVAANLLYLAIPLANRSIIAVLYGFSETGQFSLAYDLGSKAIQAIGSTLDVVLFQIAVATHDRTGAGHAKAQVGAQYGDRHRCHLAGLHRHLADPALDRAGDRARRLSRPFRRLLT